MPQLLISTWLQNMIAVRRNHIIEQPKPMYPPVSLNICIAAIKSTCPYPWNSIVCPSLLCCGLTEVYAYTRHPPGSFDSGPLVVCPMVSKEIIRRLEKIKIRGIYHSQLLLPFLCLNLCNDCLLWLEFLLSSPVSVSPKSPWGFKHIISISCSAGRPVTSASVYYHNLLWLLILATPV